MGKPIPHSPSVLALDLSKRKPIQRIAVSPLIQAPPFIEDGFVCRSFVSLSSSQLPCSGPDEDGRDIQALSESLLPDFYDFYELDLAVTFYDPDPPDPMQVDARRTNLINRKCFPRRNFKQTPVPDAFEGPLRSVAPSLATYVMIIGLLDRSNRGGGICPFLSSPSSASSDLD